MFQDCIYCHGTGMTTVIRDSETDDLYGPFTAPFLMHDKLVELCTEYSTEERKIKPFGMLCRFHEVIASCPCWKFNINQPQITDGQQAIIESLRASFGEPAGDQFEGMTWETFATINDQRKNLAFKAAKWLSNHNTTPEGKSGLLLWGRPSMGKTGLMYFTYQDRKKDGAVWVDFNELIDYIQSTYAKPQAADTDKLIRRLTATPLLFLDDMGDVERGNKVSDDWRAKTYRILSVRHAHKRLTFITTNLNCSQIEKRWGDKTQMEYQFGGRIWQRIKQLCAVVEIGGANLRERGQVQQSELEVETEEGR